MGPEMAAEVLGLSLAGARCGICQAAIAADGPATVVALRSPTGARAVFAHPTCSPSRLHEVDTVSMPAPGDEETMWLTPFLASQGATVMPALVAEVATRMFRVPGPGEVGDAVDLIVTTLLGQGFALITRLRQPVRPLPGWTATVTGDGNHAHMTITTSAGGLFYEGPAQLPAGWVDAAQATGWCAVYGGAVQMPGRGSPEIGLKALQAAVAAGGLVGGRVAVAVAR